MVHAWRVDEVWGRSRGPFPPHVGVEPAAVPSAVPAAFPAAVPSAVPAAVPSAGPLATWSVPAVPSVSYPSAVPAMPLYGSSAPRGNAVTEHAARSSVPESAAVAEAGCLTCQRTGAACAAHERAGTGSTWLIVVLLGVVFGLVLIHLFSRIGNLQGTVDSLQHAINNMHLQMSSWAGQMRPRM